METNSYSLDEQQAARSRAARSTAALQSAILRTVISKLSLIARCALACSLVTGATLLSGCQLGTRQPLNLPPGLGSPHNSSFKPTTPQTTQQQPVQQSTTQSASQPTTAEGYTGTDYTARVRGQSGDGWNNTIGGDTSGRPMQPTVAPNNRYTGQSTLQPRGVVAPTQFGSQQPVYQAQQPQLGAPQTSVYAQPVTYQQPQAFQQAPVNQIPPANQQPSVYQQPFANQQPQAYQQPPAGTVAPAGMDPYASSPSYNQFNQGNYPGAVTPPAVGYGAPGTYQTPGQYAPGQYSAGQSEYNSTIAPGSTGFATTPEANIAPGVYQDPNSVNDPNGIIATQPFEPYQPRERIAPLDVYVQEARTGRIMIGGSVNSDLGVSGQLTIDERNFDIMRVPSSWDDLWSGKAFRGRGQNFRAELMPGTLVQRYTVNWSERNFLDTPYSLSVGGFLFTRQFRDWTEQRLGGRVAVGYEITKDLSLSTELRMEDVKVFDPRKLGVAPLDRALGSSDLYTGRVRLAHDTRDSPFMSTEGHLLELIYDQVFGEFDYPRGMINYNRYFLMRERPDQTGRHTLASTWRVGLSGADTPIFENFFAGGYSTLRGFRFRGASPKIDDVQVGGQFMFLGSLEYVFPLTADEMLRGVAFVDYGTIEQDFTIKSENIRVAPGFGLRVSIPALGPAPLAFDFAYPVSKADGDETQVFSFFMGFTR